jgi:hypothetical protein
VRHHALDHQRFDRDGVVVVPGFLEEPLLVALRADVDALLLRMQAALPTSELTPGPAGVGHVGVGDERFIIRVDGLVEYNLQPSVMALLGCPAFGELASALTDHAVVTQVDLVVRNRGDEQLIAWHQDVVFERTHQHAAFGFALDDTTESEGGLLTLPGSQHVVQDICALEDEHGFDPPNLRRIAPSAGDLVIHDTMLVHASLPLVQMPRRRTLYVYVDSADRIRASEPASAAWLEWRSGLWGAARRAWDAFSGGCSQGVDPEWPGELPPPPRIKPRTLAGNYCVRHGGVALGNTAAMFARGL